MEDSDQNWLYFCVQARHVEGGSTGLIPSQVLEEKRKAFVKRDVELTPAGSWIQLDTSMFAQEIAERESDMSELLLRLQSLKNKHKDEF